MWFLPVSDGRKLLGIAGTLDGSVMWARRATDGAVIMAVMGVILFALIYGNRVRFGFDDPKVMVIPFAVLAVISLFIGRMIGRASNQQMSPTSINAACCTLALSLASSAATM
jgi:hypothetical protein